MNRTSLLFVLALVAAPVLPACAIQTAQDDEAAPTEQSDEDLSLTVGKFETFVGKDGQHYFHLLAGNGQKVLASQAYVSLGGAQGGIASVMANGVSKARYEIREATDGESYFVLKASNGQVIAVSEMYVSQSNANRALATVVRIVKATVALAAAEASTARIQDFRGIDKQYYFHVRAGNGEIVLQSEGYVSHTGALSGEASVRANGAIASRYHVVEAADGQYYFVVKAGNGAVIARGETYASRSNAVRGVADCVALFGGTIN